MKRSRIIAAIIVIATLAGAAYFLRFRIPGTAPAQEGEQAFSRYGLKTDTARASIPLEAILSGGPGKDGIPALQDPRFTDVGEADFADDALGILVDLGGERRFYPYAILVWHEIVNDRIGDTPFAVTFCPLCGSGIVFDRRVGGDVLTFGVSGLLWESNLLMYDTETESLWSQAKNEAVVGGYLGGRLTVLPMRQRTMKEMRAAHPSAKVLSKETGYLRDYDRNPYAGYEDAASLLFPVSVSDQRYPAKEIMYVMPYRGKSYAIPQRELAEGQERVFKVDAAEMLIFKRDSSMIAGIGGTEVPGYYEMWFSWATQHQHDGKVLGDAAPEP